VADYVRRTIHDVEYRVLPVLDGGRYQVETILAAGGQGFTLIARDSGLANNRVLIKVPLYGSEQLGLGERDFLSAKRERGKVLLGHEVPIVLELNRRVQNVPRLVSYFVGENAQLYGRHRLLGGGGQTWEVRPGDEAGRDVFLIYEFLSAGARARAVTLDDMIADRGVLAEGLVLRMALQIADVLAELHDQQEAQPGEEEHAEDGWDLAGEDDWEGYETPPQPEKYFYIYQDLKPANILVTGERHFFLIDFGGVARCDLSIVKGKPVFAVEEGGGAYTVGYAPPERVEHRHSFDQRFDIYGLGVTMFHALAGVSPVQLLADPTNLESSPDFSTQNLREKAPAYRPKPLVGAIVTNATQANPYDRYPSIQQMRADIVRALQEG
jgi:serine/threonine protein kinase